jgi:hypothetical protein
MTLFSVLKDEIFHQRGGVSGKSLGAPVYCPADRFGIRSIDDRILSVPMQASARGELSC